MTEIAFSRRFLRDLAEWEGSASADDLELLDHALSAIARNPSLPGRVPSFYDPAAPSHLYRAGPILIHYRSRQDDVEFLNLFFRR